MARIFQDGLNTYGGVIKINGGIGVSIGGTRYLPGSREM